MASSINASTIAGVVTTADTSGVLNIQTAGTTAITVDTSQNVGVGVTPSAWGTSNKAIDVASYVSFGYRSATNGTVISNNSYLTSGDVWTYKNTAAASAYQQIGGVHYWSVAASGTAGTTVTGFNSAAMALDASGRLGLGTTSPTTPLQIQTAAATGVNSIFCTGSTTAYNFWTISNTTGQARIGVDSSSGGALATNSTAYSTVVGSSSATSLHLISNGTVQATIDTSGNLLVGTTSTSYSEKFNSTQSANLKAGLFFNTNASFTNNVLNLRASRNTTNSSYGFLQCSIDGVADKLYIYDSGNVVNTNNSYGALSDVKLKENIVDATPKLDGLMQVKVRNYNLIGDTQKQIGVVAQELEQVFPSMIDEAPDRDADGNDLGTTTKSVKYSVFVPMLIKGLQEQQALITQLQADVAALKGA
jgi:hypothetical protein